jgi:hypothetical protein
MVAQFYGLMNPTVSDDDHHYYSYSRGFRNFSSVEYRFGKLYVAIRRGLRSKKEI